MLVVAQITKNNEEFSYNTLLVIYKMAWQILYTVCIDQAGLRCTYTFLPLYQHATVHALIGTSSLSLHGSPNEQLSGNLSIP